jgi:hypothetical protein
VGRDVYFLDAPTALLRATIHHGEEMLRELAMVAASDLPQTLIGIDDHEPLDVLPLLVAVEDALADDRDKADLKVSFVPDALQGARDRLASNKATDRLADEGKFLTLSAAPIMEGCRQWYLGQIVLQLQGDPPTAWSSRHLASRSAATYPLHGPSPG